MADFYTTHIKAAPKVIDALINMTPGHEFEGHVDFNCVVPTPENVSQDEGRPEDAHAKGMIYWRDWNVENWGTKWNAGDSFRKSDKSVYFDTAWAAPWPVLEALSKMFPQEEIIVRVAGETNRHFAGKFAYLNGIKTEVGDILLGVKHDRFAGKVRRRQFA
jgi:hypothetical protein